MELISWLPCPGQDRNNPLVPWHGNAYEQGVWFICTLIPAEPRPRKLCYGGDGRWDRPMVTGTVGVAYRLTVAASVPVGQALCLGGTHLFQLSSILTIIPGGRSQLSVG